MKIFRGTAMNTGILTAGLSPVAAAEAFEWFQQVEKRFSRFIPDSELSRVNRNAGTRVPVSGIFFQVVKEACSFYEETGGIFSPFLGLPINRLGYRQSFERMSPERSEAINTSGGEPMPGKLHKIIALDGARRTVKLAKRVALDFGGFVKSWSVQKFAEKLTDRSLPAGLIDAGGDLFAWNESGTQQSWSVGVASPYSDQETIMELRLKKRAGMATSSKVKRSWRDGNGRSYHHIIDPRTALPACSDCVQATVVGDALLWAEVYAKCLVILGTREGPAWLAGHRPDLAYVMVDENGKISVSSNLQRYCFIA